MSAIKRHFNSRAFATFLLFLLTEILKVAFFRIFYRLYDSVNNRFFFKYKLKSFNFSVMYEGLIVNFF